jgi:hypothetical protein
VAKIEEQAKLRWQLIEGCLVGDEEGFRVASTDGMTTAERNDLALAYQMVRDHNAALKLDTLVATLEELDRRMNEDETFMVVTEGDEEIIKFYNIPCGPWHHILGMIRGL